MTIVDRYIAKLFLGYFLGGLIIFVTIYLAVDFMSSMSRYQVEFGVLAKYYGYLLPSIIHQMIPVACLLGTVFTIGTLSKTHELTALFSMGQSLARVSLPVLVLVALISVLAFWLNDRLIPKFQQKRLYVEYVDIKKKPGLYSTVKTNKIWYRTQNMIFNIRNTDPQKGIAYGTTFYYFDENWALIQLITAKEAQFGPEIWTLKDGKVTIFNKDSSFPLTQSFGAKTIAMDRELADIQSTATSSATLTQAELKKFIMKNKEAGLETLTYEMDYHSKFGFAMAGFVMALLGLPLSVQRQRSGGLFLNVGVCLGLAVGYWLFFSSSVTLGRHGAIPPLLSVWGPNLLMLAFASYLIARLKR